MASHTTLCLDLQYVIEKIDVLRELPSVEALLSMEDRDELHRIWRDQEERGFCSTKENVMQTQKPEHAA